MTTLKRFARKHRLACGVHPSYPGEPIIPCTRDGVIICNRGERRLAAGAFSGTPPNYVERAGADVRVLGIDKEHGRRCTEYALVFDPTDYEAVDAVLRLARPEPLPDENTSRMPVEGSTSVVEGVTNSQTTCEACSLKRNRGRPRNAKPTSAALRMRRLRARAREASRDQDATR